MNPQPQQKPDELVTIVNGKTKQVKQVKRSQLADYGLPPDYISQADTYANSVKAGVVDPAAVPESYRAGAMQSLNNSGYTPKTKTEIDLENSKLKAKPAAKALSEGVDKLKRQAKDADLADVVASKLTGGNMGVDADLFDQSKKLLGQTIAKLYEGGRLSDADRKFYQDEVLKVNPVGNQDAIERKLDNLRQDVLRTSGYKPEDFTGKITDKKTSSNKQGVANRLITGATKNIVEGAQGLGNLAVEGTKAGANVAKDIQQTGGKNLQWGNLLPTYQQAGGAIVNDLNETAGRPLEGGDVLGRAGEHAIDNPVNTALLVAPGAKVAKEAGVVGKTVGAAKGAVKGATGKLPKIGGGKLTNDIATNAFANNFTIPSKLASRIKIDEVSRKLLENGHSGNLDELEQVANQVTGQNGIFPKLNREALARVKKPIPFDKVTTVANKALEDIPELDKKQKASHLKVIEGLTKQGETIGQTNPLDAFDTVQELEKRGYQYKNSSTKMTPNLVNERIGDAYVRAADELKDQLEAAYKDEDVLTALKTPQALTDIQAISPKLAEEFMAAKTMKDLRKIQSPYVRLNQAIELTRNAENTPFNKMAGGVARGIGATVGAGIGSFVPGVGPIAGAAIGGIAPPFLQPIVQSVLPKITTKIASKLSRKGSQLPPIR